MTRSYWRTRKLGSIALAASAALLLASCAGGSNAGSDVASGSEGEGLPADATKEEFIAAFEDIEPIQLYTQTPAPKGGAAGLNIESYVEQVEDWSGGKITFEVGYSNAVAGADEIGDALKDGRLDLANFLPMYEPSDYPAMNELLEAGVLHDGSPVVGTMQTAVWANEVAFNTPEIMEEWDRQGIIPLMPVFISGNNGLFCSDERSALDALDGATIAADGSLQAGQTNALGASPVSIIYTEFFESLQRGVVDCVIQNGAGAELGGFIPEAPHVVMDPQEPMAIIPGTFAFSQSTWETLPLVAQQLLWDRLDIYFEEGITVKAWPPMAGLAETAKSNGGSLTEFDDSARQAIAEHRETVLDELRGSEVVDGQALVDNSIEASEKWTKEIEELGFDSDIDYTSFGDWWDEAVDISPFTEKVMKDVFGPQRPQ